MDKRKYSLDSPSRRISGHLNKHELTEKIFICLFLFFVFFFFFLEHLWLLYKSMTTSLSTGCMLSTPTSSQSRSYGKKKTSLCHKVHLKTPTGHRAICVRPYRCTHVCVHLYVCNFMSLRTSSVNIRQMQVGKYNNTKSTIAADMEFVYVDFVFFF